MLVLTRKIGESIVVDDNVTLKVLDITPTGVKLGFEAPKKVSIIREELIREMRDFNYKANQNHEQDEEGLNALHERLKK